MEILIDYVDGFNSFFHSCAEILVGFVIGMIPLVLIMMTAMNTFVKLIGEKRVLKFAKFCSKNWFGRNMLLPFISHFVLLAPMSLTVAKYLPEFYKPSFYTVVTQFGQTNLGLFPHMNPSEVFTWLGIASGLQILGVSTTRLAIAYFALGFILNGLGGVVTDFTTGYLCKKKGIELSKEIEEI